MSDFKSQQEIWAYLAADENNRVQSLKTKELFGFSIGELKNFTKEIWSNDRSFCYHDDWSKYTPPKPKVKLYKYAYMNKADGEWKESVGFYDERKHLVLHEFGCGEYKLLRLDNSFIEVDDE